MLLPGALPRGRAFSGGVPIPPRWGRGDGLITARLGKRLALILATCLIVGLGALLAAACGEPARQLSPSPSPSTLVLLRVDGLPVAEAEVEALRAEARFGGTDDGAAEAREQAVRRLLVRRQADQLGVTVAEQDYEARRAALVERVGGEAVLAAALEGAGMTSEQLAAAVRYSLLEGALQDAMFADLTTTGAAVGAFYREHRAELFTRAAEIRLRRITLPTEGLARRVASDIAAGASFAAVARRHSLDAESRDEGGMLGWVAVASLPAEVQAALVGVRRGAVCEPVRSFGRWHLYKVIERRPVDVVPLADVRSEIRTELTRRLRAAALDDWVQRAREKVTVESVR